MWDALDGCFTSPSRVSFNLGESHAEIAEKMLHKFIVEVWLDNAPGAFLGVENPTSKLTDLRLVHAVVMIARTIYYTILQGSSKVRGFTVIRAMLINRRRKFPQKSSHIWKLFSRICRLIFLSLGIRLLRQR